MAEMKLIRGVAQIFDKYGDLIEAESDNTNSWMDQAAYYGQFEMMEFLRSKGFTYTHSPKGRPLGLLKEAQYGKQLAMTRFLLDKGLFSNEQRILFGAINMRESPLEWVTLYVDHGADVNWCVKIAGPEVKWATPLDWARGKQGIMDYLLSKGAVTADDPRANRRDDD